MVEMERSVTRFVWDVDLEETKIIYQDIGVKELETLVEEKLATERRQGQKRRATFTTPENQQQCLRTSSSSEKHGCKCQLFQPCSERNEIDSFESLSDEIILSILRWLPRQQLAKCACLSKRWKRLCMDEFLWKRVDLSEKKFASGTLGPILLRTGNAAKLARSTIIGSLFENNSSQIPDEIHLTLQYLDLSMCNSRPKLLQEILSKCTSLRKLSLESCTVTEGMLTSIGAQGGLEELNLCMCQEIDDTELQLSLAKCQRLKSLNLAWLNLSRKVVRSLVEVLPQSLEKLNIGGCRESLRDEDIEILAARCQSLIELDLSDGSSLTGSIFVDLGTLSGLQHLALSRCYRIPNPMQLMDCLKRLKVLKAVELFGLITEKDLKVMSEMLSPVRINTHPFSSISRPTMSMSKRSYTWEINCKE
ncbi:putative S-phase kinase-associated protein 2 [Apostichopus japonicus]|uniref:Putative S-phase kinase-associated protein 2 n=1 Tax=Stichopus japonicus TaxID=307972 RepID=A0A2G8KUX2_STIJA|nr:putative S-phase kinase-associated protein 2 [Apostichopus japonicus]